jgi:outer membrane protein assembly factor BamC
VKKTSALLFLVLLASTPIAGCSLLPNHRLDYQKITPGAALQLPPGTTMNNASQAYTLPDKGPLLTASQQGHFSVPLPTQMPSIVEQQKEQKNVPAGPAPDVSRVQSVMANDGNGYPIIMMHTRFAWAWEYVGDALKKSGIRVTDKDRAAGLYFIRLAKGKHGDRDAQIKLSHTTNGVQVVAMNKKGDALLDKPEGQLLLASIYAEL